MSTLRAFLFLILPLIVSCSKKKQKVLMPLSIWKIAQSIETTGEPSVLIDITIVTDSTSISHRVPLGMSMVKSFVGLEYQKQTKTKLYHVEMSELERDISDSVMDSLLMLGYYNGFTFTHYRIVDFIDNAVLNTPYSEKEYQSFKIRFDSINGTTSEAVEFFDNLTYFARYYIEKGALCLPPAYGGFPPRAIFLSDEEIQEILLKEEYTKEQIDFFCSVNP